MLILIGGEHTVPNPEIPKTLRFCKLLKDAKFANPLLRHIPTSRVLIMGNDIESQVSNDPGTNFEIALSGALNAVLGPCFSCPDYGLHNPKAYATPNTDPQHSGKFIPVVSVTA